ncbi:CHAT domain-containing protein [Dyadobacter sp. NIV53]|uniref:CHAT domain-containing protein n=1 Tax=Dyadobacter sp. NIV53 TaxID=2861765 RepID=UPI001C876E9F|nr:CHAT domain-containing protein [Dyadobacter sp. NIV53]
MYEKAIEACYLANNAETAFFFMEKSRAVLLNDKLNELGALAKLPLAETFRDQKYRAKVTLALQNTMSSKPDSKEWEKNLSQLLTVKTDFENYIKTLETKYPAYYQYKYSSDVPTLSVLKNNLHKKKASFIQYFMADSMTYILYVTSAQVKISRLTPEKLSLAKINRFNQICSDKKFQNNQYHTFALMSHELYVTLIQPLALHEGRVIICADNILIPFEALSKDSLGTHFLLNDYIFSYTYSASFLLKDFPVTIPKGDFIGFAPVHFQPHLNVPDLKESGNLMRDAAKFYSNSVVHTGLEATKNCFLDDVFNYGVVNIFSHASAGSAESESYLYLQDSIIRLSELNLSRRLATRLIILTACETNIGKSARGEGIFSLARGFASAGTQSIAATLWQADEDAIYAISTLFNQYLAQGMDKGDALRKAKINFIKADNGEKTMPYYWANMVLIGNSDSIKLTNPNYIWPFALILVAILLFILLFRLLRHQVDI